MYSPMAAINSGTLVNTPWRSRSVVMSRKMEYQRRLAEVVVDPGVGAGRTESEMEAGRSASTASLVAFDVMGKFYFPPGRFPADLAAWRQKAVLFALRPSRPLL